MLISQQHDPRIVFIQMSTCINEQSIFHYISVSVADNLTNMVFIPVLRVSNPNNTIVDMPTFVCDRLICKLVPPLYKKIDLFPYLGQYCS